MAALQAAGPTLQVRSSSERTIERRLSPQPNANEATQRTKEEEEEEMEDRFSPSSSSCALPPSIRWENVSTLASSSAGDQSLEGGDLTPVGGKFEESQESPANLVKKGGVHSSKGAAAEYVGPGAGGSGATGGLAGAKEVGLGGARGAGGGGLNERCKDVLRPATASSGVEYPSAQFHP